MISGMICAAAIHYGRQAIGILGFIERSDRDASSFVDKFLKAIGAIEGYRNDIGCLRFGYDQSPAFER